MTKKFYKLISWIVFGLFVLSAILIAVFNFVFQIVITNLDSKMTLLLNSLFIILNSIILGYLIFLWSWNANKQSKDVLLNVALWILTGFYIFFSIASTLVLLLDALPFTQILTICFYTFSLFLFPLIVFNFLSPNFKNQKVLNYFIIVFLIFYLLINLTLTLIVLLDYKNIIALLVSVTSLNLVISSVFFGLLTLKSNIIFKEK